MGFRCWSQGDLPLARDLWGDLEATKFFGGPFPDGEIERRLQVEVDRAAAHNFQYWPMHLLDGGEFVGCCGLCPYKLQQGIPELGFHLCRKSWGGGLATEAAATVIHHAFHSLDFEALSAGHHPENANSKKVLEELGFQYTHDEFFPALGMHIPYYLLTKPQGDGRN